ncbi:ChrR family anti-sigma-E factor [Pelagovum pacificum]|uniref:Transcriptional regulator n=1 Tax=Pelagovum pacificum TaxID=2588711 RepID=A0A5C5GG29_9RHOB|nr:ChrR family anti-sigma-E factor [Pelagovum pacificum]QQA43139.1 cupin domain-containing protein [Pelagovum pacificum]TNY33718.1 transcriptional regulator [Pelagovum pacificum]
MTMYEINHHLTDELLMSYSAGTLPEAFSIAVAAHLSMCDECRAQAATFDAIGGAILEEGRAEMSADALAKALGRIRGSKPEARRAPPVKSDLPAPVRDYVGGDLASIRWKPVGGGVKQALLHDDGVATARLLCIPGGASVPDHGHAGTELTLVLKGAFADEYDRFGPGDIEVADEDVDHQPVAEPGADCICLAATDARLRFHGWIPRLAGRIMRI